MDKSEIRSKFSKIKVITRDGEKALHKPLLLLLVLGKYSRGQSRIIPFTDVEKELTSLLKKYGPTSKSSNPHLPFWHLQNDGIWELINDDNLRDRKGHSEPTSKQMIDQNVMGGLTKEIYQGIKLDPGLLRELVQLLVDAFIPKQHAKSVLRDVGLGQG